MHCVKKSPAKDDRRPLRVVLAPAMALACLGANAASLVDGDSFSLRWDNTLKYGVSARTSAPSATYLTNVNTNDGDGAFGRWDLIANRFDLLSELDLAVKTNVPMGLRISGAAWYDEVYNRSHNPIDSASYNAVSVSNDAFTETARRMAGRDGDLLDAFVYGGLDFGGGHLLQARLGRHTLLWGESLFLASNGVAYGMSAVDYLKMLSVPQSQAKELFLPTNQLSASYSLNSQWGLQGYYQMEFRQNRFAPPGTFFSGTDVGFQGMESVVVPGFGFRLPYAGVRNQPRSAQGNWGLAAKYSNPATDVDAGFYYLRYTDRTPQIYGDARGVAGGRPGYYFVYPKNVEVIGTSASTRWGDANVAGELSIRRNQPLMTNAQAMDLFANPAADNGDTTLYAKGKSLHWQASTIWVLPRVSFWDQSSVTAEVGGHTLLKVTDNSAVLDRAKKRNFVIGNVVFQPTWYRIGLDDLDVDVPVSLGYSPTGQSVVDGTPGHSGVAAVGVKLTYQRVWRAQINYSKFLGRDNATLYGDRDNLSFTVARTF